MCSGTCFAHLINPRRAYAARVTVLGLLVCLSVLLPRFLPLRATRQQKSDTIGLAIDNIAERFRYNIIYGLALHWLVLEIYGDFRKSTAFESYGMKSEQANCKLA